VGENHDSECHRKLPRVLITRFGYSNDEALAGDPLYSVGLKFYDVVEGKRRSERAAWSYEAPRPAMKQVDHWVGFWDDVEVG